MRSHKQNIFKAIFNSKKTGTGVTNFSNARKLIECKIELRKLGIDIFLVCLGILYVGFGLKGFLLPNNFFAGSATGISLLRSELTGTNLLLLLIVINIPFINLGYYILGRQFAMKTAFAITRLALFVAVINKLKVELEKIETNTFVGMSSVKDMKCDMIKKKTMKN